MNSIRREVELMIEEALVRCWMERSRRPTAAARGPVRDTQFVFLEVGCWWGGVG